MSETEVVETIRMPDGTEYRAVLIRDESPEPPEDGGAWPILRLDYKAYEGWRAEAFNEHAEPYVAAFNRLADHESNGHNSELFERYIAIFHGGTLAVYWGRENTRATDSTYLAFDTAKWRDDMGLCAPPLINESPLAEIEAWVEGDVWGIGVEKRWNPDSELEDDEGWTSASDDLMTVWGYYGKEYAEREARGELNLARERHKFVHRYPEHEKIDPHKAEIEAVLGFLEGLGGYTDDEDGWGIALCKWSSNRREYEPIPDGQHQKVVFEHFGIDYSKIQEERELMFKRLREEATPNE